MSLRIIILYAQSIIQNPIILLFSSVNFISTLESAKSHKKINIIYFWHIRNIVQDPILLLVLKAKSTTILLFLSQNGRCCIMIKFKISFKVAWTSIVLFVESLFTQLWILLFGKTKNGKFITLLIKNAKRILLISLSSKMRAILWTKKSENQISLSVWVLDNTGLNFLSNIPCHA